MRRKAKEENKKQIGREGRRYSIKWKGMGKGQDRKYKGNRVIAWISINE